MKTITMNVKGMHCTSCEMLITDALKDAGVSDVKIFHKTGHAKMTFDEKKIDEKKIKATIEKEGYNVA